MNASEYLIGATMPRFSTDPTALSVNYFIARRAALTSRPDMGEEHGLSRPAAPLEVLYPSLYAKRSTPSARWRDYVRAVAGVFALAILGGRSGRAVHSDETLPAS